MSITYTHITAATVPTWNVSLDGKFVGRIKKTVQGWSYFPQGSRDGGEPFATFRECQRGIEGADEPQEASYA